MIDGVFSDGTADDNHLYNCKTKAAMRTTNQQAPQSHRFSIRSKN
jgi:hypothetical protein